MMRTFFKSAFVLTILAVWAAPVYSVDKVVPEEGALEVMLLRQQSIQKELKLTDDAIEKVHKHCSQQWEKAQAVGKLSEKEQDMKFNELSKENERFVEATLTKEQRKRLHEITLQVVGLLCVTRQEIASKLKLTEEQKKRLPQLHKEARQEAEDWIYAVKKEQKREKLQELRAASRKRLMDLLTDEQEATWKEMVGEPFKGDLYFFDAEQASK